MAGDLNIIENPRVKMLNWFLGASVYESLPWYSERARFEKRFLEAKLKNPLRNKITHGFSKSQLDHILVSESLTITDSGVHADRHGSDHSPVYVDLAPHE
jgi:endonuclease/exonuclease/phosphatase family metal-dependent hydrolase